MKYYTKGKGKPMNGELQLELGGRFYFKSVLSLGRFSCEILWIYVMHRKTETHPNI
jgi:hypothetical protein